MHPVDAIAILSYLLWVGSLTKLYKFNIDNPLLVGALIASMLISPYMAEKLDLWIRVITVILLTADLVRQIQRAPTIKDFLLGYDCYEEEDSD